MVEPVGAKRLTKETSFQTTRFPENPFHGYRWHPILKWTDWLKRHVLSSVGATSIGEVAITIGQPFVNFLVGG
jgi:hypothetical protein